MDNGFVVFDNPAFDEHDPGYGHPECPERLPIIRSAIASAGWPVLPGREALRSEIEQVHSPEYVQAILSCRGRYVLLDHDTGTSPGSVQAALLAAGAAVEGAERLRQGLPSFVLCRPPGHHATPDRAMGFCLFNNAAIAAAHLARSGMRIAIFDPDVHHGNGTQEAFYERNDVLYASLHRFPYFPGTGRISEIGEGPGAGFTLNVPLPAGAGDDWYLPAFQSLVLPRIEAFAPDACIVSAGFDSLDGDYLGQMRLSRAGYGEMVGALSSRWPTMGVLEGGYTLQQLGDDARAILDVLAGGEVPDVQVEAPPRWALALREWPHPFFAR
jgi:acetoin utilization deacetylase AcuC-like enzyme